LVDDLDRLETQRKASKARIRTAVAASGTTLTDIFGVGDVVAATLIGHTGNIDRFPTADRFAAYNGTAPIEWSSGNPKRPTGPLPVGRTGGYDAWRYCCSHSSGGSPLRVL
jgi:transposase